MNRLKKLFAEIISWIIGGLGILATIVCSVLNGDSAFISLYVVAVALETILTCIAIWHISIKQDYKSRIEEMEGTIVEKNARIDNLVASSNVLKKQTEDKYKKAMATIISTTKNASKLNNDLCNRIPDINARSYSLLDTLQKSGISDQTVLQHEITKSYEEFANALFDLFKRYSSNLLSYVVAMVEGYLKTKDCLLPIAATIKLFDKPLNARDDRGKITVYTAFRDKRTYDEHEREIGLEPYTIGGNVDFGHCLVKDHYIINNAKKDSGSYLNEHIDFDKYYNCAVVVPIRVKQVDSTYKFLGYLCCDCLNQHDSCDEIFDKEVAQMLFAMAQIYGTFLETLESNWTDRASGGTGLSDSILALIYSKTFVGKKSERIVV